MLPSGGIFYIYECVVLSYDLCLTYEEKNMRVLHVVETNEFGDDFEFIEGKWKVKFPPITETTYKLSEDFNNAIELDETQAIVLKKDKLYAYIMVQDNVAAKVYLYRYPAGSVFDALTAVIVGTVDMVEVNTMLDDIAITDAIIEFTDIQSDSVLEFNTNLLQKANTIVAGDGIKITDNPLAGALDYIEFDLTLSTHQNGATFSIYDETGRGWISLVMTNTYSAASMAEALNASIREMFIGEIEFYDLSPTVVGDGKLTSRIGVRNLHSENHKYLFRIDEVVPLEVPVTEEFGNITGSRSYWLEHKTDGGWSIARLNCNLVAKANIVINPPKQAYVLVNVSDDPENTIGDVGGGIYVEVADVPSPITHRLFGDAVDAPVKEGVAMGQMTHVINNPENLTIPLTTLVNARGKVLGSVIKTISSPIHSQPLE